MLRLSTTVLRRSYTTASNVQEAWLYIDSVFPIQLAAWDLRHYIGILRQEHLLTVLQNRLDQLSNVCNFKPLEFQPQMKDGGVFVRFSYTPEASSDGSDPMISLQQTLRDELAKVGTLPTWNGIGAGDIWVVKGSPWNEDMNRFASPILKVAFEGPDVQEQSLYELCRPYGRIKDLAQVPTVPVGTLRFSTVTFRHVNSAAIARNVIHGFKYPLPSPEPSSQTKTRLRVEFQKPLQAHAIRDWISGHPKIVLPVVVFLLGSLTYTIFDPIRSLMVEAKMLDWLDYRKFRVYQWLQAHALEPFAPSDGKAKNANIIIDGEAWEDRQDAATALQSYLSDTPSTVAFVHGPQGSGKTSMLQAVLRDSKRNTLTIDCRQLQAASSDSALVAALAAQTGYWPVFNVLSSMSTLIDLASVGLIGQKAGMSSSLTEQLHKMLDVVSEGLRGVSASHKAAIQKRVAREEAEEQRRVYDNHRRQAIIDGRWHDARLDCVAGNGIMSELGVGDEMFGDEVVVQQQNQEHTEAYRTIEEAKTKKKQILGDEEAIQSLPVVVIRNYASSSREEVMNVLAQWAASLAENHIAHVVVLSDNRENAKRLTKALPTKPLNSIALSDADARSSLSFVKQKLHDTGLEIELTTQDAQFVERLGGRASDLESLIHKVRTGMKVEEAVEDIIARGVVELRKNTFGEDAEESKNLPWTKYQAWKVLKVLAKSPEVGYYDMLVDFPFKGDENALRAMEHAELITIVAKNGRPSGIRPGKPVFRWVFERVVNDKVFQATQELAYNEKQVSDTEAKIQGYEQELKLLVDMMQKENRPWYSFRRSPCLNRARSVGEKLVIAERKVSTLERKIVELKKVLAGNVLSSTLIHISTLMEALKVTLAGHLLESATLARDATLSRAWTYPVLGVTYLISHPTLYKAVAPLIMKAIGVSIGITAALFFFTYLPQVAFCALFSGPFAFLTAAVMVLGEAYIVISLVSKAFFLGAAQDRIFDAVLVQQGNQTLVEKGRMISSNSSGFKVIGRSITKPINRLSTDNILRYIVSLPLNSIPAVGTVLFLLYNGIKAGPRYHARYFQLKGYDKRTREEFVEKRKGEYTAFGAVAVAFNLIPIVGLLFNVTSTVGAALWANKMEKRQDTVAGSGRKVDRIGESADDMKIQDQELVQL